MRKASIPPSEELSSPSLMLQTTSCHLSSSCSSPMQTSNLVLIKKRNRLRQEGRISTNIMNLTTDTDIFTNMRRKKIVGEFIRRLKLNTVHRSNQYIQTTLENIATQNNCKMESRKEEKLHISERKLEGLFLIVKLLLLLMAYFSGSVVMVMGRVELLAEANLLLVFLYLLINFLEIFKYWYNLYQQKEQVIQIKFSFILHEFIKEDFYLQVLMMIFTLTAFLTKNTPVCLIQTFLILIKLHQLSGLLQKKEIYIIHSYITHKYWDIIKIVIFNLVIAHSISLLLNVSAVMSQEEYGTSWYTLKSMNHNNWYEKYLWGYYWAISIMFTIGFGDINATTIIQSIFVICVSIVSCLILAYNISEINRMLQRLSLKNEELKSRLSEFNKISKRYSMTGQVKRYFEKYMEKEFEDKLQYDYSQEQRIISELPHKLQVDFKREINKNIFQHLYFFKELTKKTQYLLAENLVNKIAHPEELFMKKNEKWKIHILRLGELKLCYKRDNAKINGISIEKFKVKDGEMSQLLSLKFLKNSLIEGDIIACKRSIISEMAIDDFQIFLKDSNSLMHEYYCQLRDSNEEYLFNYGTTPCPLCLNLNHLKFDCPLMHYFPLKHFLIYKLLVKGNRNKQKRKFRKRNKNIFRALIEPLSDQEEIFSRIGFTEKILRLFNKEMNRIDPNYDEYSLNCFEENPTIKKLEKCELKLREILSILKNDEAYYKSKGIDSDKACNFHKYYPDFNPCNLIKKERFKTQKNRFQSSSESLPIPKSITPNMRYFQLTTNIY